MRDTAEYPLVPGIKSLRRAATALLHRPGPVSPWRSQSPWCQRCPAIVGGVGDPAAFSTAPTARGPKRVGTYDRLAPSPMAGGNPWHESPTSTRVQSGAYGCCSGSLSRTRPWYTLGSSHGCGVVDGIGGPDGGEEFDDEFAQLSEDRNNTQGEHFGQDLSDEFAHAGSWCMSAANRREVSEELRGPAGRGRRRVGGGCQTWRLSRD